MNGFRHRSPHRPLAGDGSEMRVVTLQPGSSSEPITCTTEHVPLGSSCGYEALSYAWGDVHNTISITLDGHIYPVTTNLMSALQNLRWKTKPRRLWIDSLCINQTDIQERNSLVPRMREIYAAADSVVIWLGDYAPHSVNDFHDCFKVAVARSNLFKDPKGPYAKHDEAVIDSNTHGMDILLDLLHRAWFGRMWVVQEIAVRPRADRFEKVVFAVGNLRIPYEGLARGVVGLVYIPTSLKVTEPGKMANPNLLHRIEQAWYYRNMVLANLDEAEAREFHPAEQLAFHLSRCADFQSTDPRDKFYALVGLLVGKDGWQMPTELAADYTKPVQEVQRAYTAWMLEESGSVDVLALSSFSGARTPSWVPDFEQKCGNFYTNADEMNGNPIKLLSNGMKLQIDALRVGEITAVGPRCEVDVMLKQNGRRAYFKQSVALFLQSCKDYLVGCEGFVAQQARLPPSSQAISVRGRLIEYLCRCIDVMPNRTRMKSPKQFYNALMTGEAMTDDLEFDRWFFARHLVEMLDGLPLFAMDNGEFDFFCSKFTSPQKDDVVFILRGSTKHFVLRDAGNDEWILIGVANSTPDFARPYFSEADDNKDVNLLRLSSELWEAKAQKVRRLVIR